MKELNLLDGYRDLAWLDADGASRVVRSLID